MVTRYMKDNFRQDLGSCHRILVTLLIPKWNLIYYLVLYIYSLSIFREHLVKRQPWIPMCRTTLTIVYELKLYLTLTIFLYM